jgi:valyl-tRNA synthetase
MITGFDIIFFWVARMIMDDPAVRRGDRLPRRVHQRHRARRRGPEDVQVEGQHHRSARRDRRHLLRGAAGEVDPGPDARRAQGDAAKRIKREFPKGIDSYGADALRFTFASLSTLGRTLNFDLKRCEGYRSFCNKLWNATRFVLMNTQGKDTGLGREAAARCPPRIAGSSRRLQRAERAVNEALAEYRFDVAARAGLRVRVGRVLATGTSRSPRCRSPRATEAQQRRHGAP